VGNCARARRASRAPASNPRSSSRYFACFLPGSIGDGAPAFWSDSAGAYSITGRPAV